MSRFTDPVYLRSEQYRTASNLSVRIRLHQRFSANPQNLYRWVFDHVHLETGQRLLELGCGSGELWCGNLDRMPAGCAIILSDFSSGMLQHARQNLGKGQTGFDFVLLDVQSISFPQAWFDLVIANFMLYHVPDRARALAEIYRVLKPGGRLYAATNGKNHLREIDDLIRSVEPRADLPNPAEKFGLENGREQLAKYFQKIVLHRFEDSLKVTEAEPLVNYILSIHSFEEIQNHLQFVDQLIQKQIEAQGDFFIHKDVGIFTGVKPT